MQEVIVAFKETFTQVHVADWIDSFCELHTTRQLSVPCAPLMFDALHVPLINKNDYAMALSIVNLLEQVSIALVNKDPFDSWEVNVGRLDVPIYLEGVQTLFSEGLSANVSQLRQIGFTLISVHGVPVLEAS